MSSSLEAKYKEMWGNLKRLHSIVYKYERIP